VKVPLRLVKRIDAEPAEAFLLLMDGVRPLAALFTSTAPAPEIFRIRGGFLLIYSAHPMHEPRGAIRLRRLGTNFYLPADAELLPALLPEELADLAAHRGLIALPGGTVLAFDFRSPLAPDQWLAPPEIRRNSWKPIPPAPFQPDRLTRIEFRDDRPAAVLEILNEGAPNDAAPLTGQGEAGGDAPIPEDARPKGSGPLAKFGAGMALGGARMLAWIGKQLNMPGLAKLGGSLARKAVEQVPRLTEKILGAQEAALREVLRQLQSGDADHALRRAPIAVGDPDAKATVSDSANLGYVDPRYSLSSLLSSGNGPATAWLGGGDVWALLANEYRRLAQEALARGDYRRAAYLYGVLLRDLRSAANALSSGGLHKDAAIIYRDKLNDLPAAAQAFERAGNAEEALRLYEKMERYEDAAEMLRRMGDDERAEQLYLRAAHAHSQKHSWLAAGDLVRKKLGRHDLATEYYVAGWNFAGPEVVPCGQRLLDQSLVSGDWSKAEELFGEAEDRFAAPRKTEANEFFNYALRVKEFLPEPRRPVWQDRVRRAFANQIRNSAKPPQVAGELFADGRNWPPEVLRDAVYASRGRIKVPVPEEPPSNIKKLLNGTVVAVAVARDSRDIIVASNTAVVCWRVKENRVQHLSGSWIRNEVIGLSVDAHGENVFVLSHNGPKIMLQGFQNHVAGNFSEGGKVEFDIQNTERGEWYITPQSWNSDGEPATAIANSFGHFAYRGHIPKACTPDSQVSKVFHPPTHLLLNTESNWDEVWNWESDTLYYFRGHGDRRWQPHWHPDSPVGNPILVSPMDTLARTGVLEIAAVDRKGILCWSRFEANTGEEHTRSSQVFSTHPDRFAAACLLKEETVAAVTFKNELLWMRIKQGKLESYAPAAQLQVPSKAVFLAARPQAGEVAVILEDGSAILVRVP